MYTVTLIHTNGADNVQYEYATEDFARSMGFDWFVLVGVRGPFVGIALHGPIDPKPLDFHAI